ncbi:MAG: hypothetical protein EXR72_09035 [Myxococcales bacterium]|nr:hypothetical protein [Myxococcales bacterium]
MLATRAMSSRDPNDRLRTSALVLLGAALSVGAVLRVWLALHDDGIYWCDEIHQSLEPAHKLVFGYGLASWEFTAGARNATLSHLIALLLRAATALGLPAPRGYLLVVRLFFCALSLGSVVGSYALARAHRASPLAAAGGACLFALAGPAIYFAPRAMSESASGLAAVWGLALALDGAAGPRRVALGSSLLGFAVLLRLHNGVLCAALLVVLLIGRRRRALGVAVVTLAAWALLYGLIDRITWGHWFQSARVYLRFTLVDGDITPWGVQPVTYFPRVLFTAMPGVAIAIGLLGAVAWRRAWGLIAILLGFLALHTSYPHKELRFLLPILPALCALAGIGADVASERVRAPLCAGALVVAAAISAATFHRLTFGQLGQYERVKPEQSAYDDYGPVNRLLTIAGARPDLCGIRTETANLAWTGGYAYLHRDVPLHGRSGPERPSGRYNYAITNRTHEDDPIVASDGDMVLVRLPNRECARDPGADRGSR